MGQENIFSLERFESLVARRSYEPAAQELMQLLAKLDQNHGIFDQAETEAAVLARLAAGMSALFADPGFNLTREGFQRLVLFHRWITAIFGASVFGTSDHIIRTFNISPPERADQLEFADENLYKFALLYSLDSAIDFDPEVFWRKDKVLFTTMFFGLLSSRTVISEAAHAKREMLLRWLPSRLEEISLESVPAAYLHDVWMHCSYAQTPEKHEIKKAINRMIRRWAEAVGLTALEARPRAITRERPTLVIAFDWFHSRHVVFRVFARMLAPLRESFRVVGLPLFSNIDEPAAALFHEMLEPQLDAGGQYAERLAHVMRAVAAVDPDVVFYIGVGMSLPGIFLANLRMAPLQIASHGHPASTQADTIDYFLLEEYYRPAAARFSEKLLLIPPEALSQLPPTDFVPISRRAESKSGTLKVAVVVTVMKLNPVFLRACRDIQARSERKIQFHVMVGYARGVAGSYVEKLVQTFLPDCVFYPQIERERYLQILAACDMFLDPFPFGNANTLVDCLACGLPGICMRGEEIFGHMAAVTLERLGVDFPLTASSTEEYIVKAVDLLRNAKLRGKVRDYLRKVMVPGAIDKLDLFHGRPGILRDGLLAVCRQSQKAN